MRDHGPGGVAKTVVSGSMPVVHVRPAFVVVAHPMLLEAAADVEPSGLEGGDDRVFVAERVGLDLGAVLALRVLVGVEVIGVATTLPPAAAAAVTSATTMPASTAFGQLSLTTPDRIPGIRFRKERVHSRPGGEAGP